MKKAILALVVTVIGGVLIYWLTQGIDKGRGGGDSRPPVATMGPLEGGTNRPGQDLSTVGIQTNSAAECSDLCRDNGNCRAMTFVKHSDRNGGVCWLKGTVASPTPDPGHSVCNQVLTSSPPPNGRPNDGGMINPVSFVAKWALVVAFQPLPIRTAQNKLVIAVSWFPPYLPGLRGNCGCFRFRLGCSGSRSACCTYCLSLH